MALTLACSSREGADASAQPDGDTAVLADSDVPATDSAPEPEPGHWYLDGAWTLVAGEVDPTSTLSVRYVEDGGGDCTVEAAVTATARAPLGGHLAWDVVFTPAPEDCAWQGPTQLVVEWGPSDPALVAAADRAGLSWSTSQGLAVSEGGTPVLVGLVGTAAQLAGEAEALAAAPYPDGAYLLRGLYGVRAAGQ